MRIVSWNINRRVSEPWDYLINHIGADIALLQECSRVPETLEDSEIIHRFANDRKFGNAIYVKDRALAEYSLNTVQGGSLIVGVTDTSAGDPLVIINLYGLLEYLPVNPKGKLVHPGIHRSLSDISFLLQGLTRPRHTNFVLAGDFNNDRRMDDHPNFKRKGRRTANLMFVRIEDYLLQDCVKKFYPDYVQTYRHTTGSFPWQLDHMFASRKMFVNLKNLFVDASDEAKSISDHSPIVADFDI